MMQTDVKSKNLTSTGASGIGVPRARVKAIYAVGGITAGSVSFRDGSATGTEAIKIDVPAVTAGGNSTIMVLIPGEGVLFAADPYVTLSVVTSVTFFYG